jgi:hypothetical protein
VKPIRKVWCVARHAAHFDELTIRVDRGNGVTRCQGGELFAPA